MIEILKFFFTECKMPLILVMLFAFSIGWNFTMGMWLFKQREGDIDTFEIITEELTRLEEEIEEMKDE